MAFRVGIVAGEESGDLLGADLVAALRETIGEVELVGVGGAHLRSLGLQPLFDPSEIGLMGVAAVIRKVPSLIRRIGETARALAAAKPECVVLIDVPDFNLRVAKRLRAADPTIPIIQYVCPSVWAWRPGRAPAMRSHVDHVLCVLPFETAELERLGGPPGTYVGHRLAHDPDILAARQAQHDRPSRPKRAEKTLLVLPGSRRSEVEALTEAFGETVQLLRQRGSSFRVLLPTVPHVASLVREKVERWAVQPQIIEAREEKWRAFAEADAALAASGTVSLELALSGVPHVACYRTDWIVRLAFDLITVWSASLPNLVAGYPIVPEYYDRFIRASMLARTVEVLWSDGAPRATQLAGFGDVVAAMATSRPAGAIAADVVLDLARAGRSPGAG